MYRNRSVGVVVPAYNEEGYVGEVLATMPEFVDRTYVVDDASTDGTWAEIRETASSINDAGDPEAPEFDARVVPIQHEANRGVGGGIKTGYARALEDGVDVVAVMGGDGQMNPDDLPRYLDPIVEGAADYVKGNRFMANDIEEMPQFRLVGNAMLSLLTKIASGYWTIGDPQNGYTAISREALETVDFEAMYEYYGYCNDILVKLNVAGMRVADVPRPSRFGYDEGWKSHIQYDEYVPRVSWMLLRNFLWRLREQPGVAALSYVLGAVLLGVGLAGTLLGQGDGAGVLAIGALFVVVAAALDRRENADLGRRFAWDANPERQPRTVTDD